MKHLLMVVIAGVVSGFISPFVSGSMVNAVRWLNETWGNALIVAPFFGFWIIGFFSRYSSLILGTGVDSYKDESVRIKVKDLVLKYASTVITLGFGGSGGLVSPTLFIGKGLSEVFSRRSERMFSIAFASGMLTFYLGTPLSAALLSVEYFEKDRVTYEDIMPALLASTISYYHYKLMGYEPIFLQTLRIAPIESVGTREVLSAFVLAPIFGAIGMSVYFLKWVYRRWTDKLDVFRKTVLSGILVSVVGLLIDPRVLGLKVAYGPDAHYATRFLTGKILATVFTIESMGSSGYFTPLTTMGMNLGYAFSALGFDQNIASVVGISALLSSMLNVPIAAVVFPLELFGHGALIPAAIGSSVAYMLYKRFRLE